jgi:feruloyl esterase
MRRGLAITAALAALAAGSVAHAQSNQMPASRFCDAGVLASVPDVRIVEAAPAPGLPGVCRIQAVAEKEIGFELWLPMAGAWNGRLLAAGVGGQAGQVNTPVMRRAAQRGYAATSNDSGHKAADTHWLLNNPERAANYAGRANHVVTEKAKLMTAAFYGRPAAKAFFVGCSGGGRQALTEMQRYPEDFDAIIAGAPGVNTPQMSARRMWEMTQHSAHAGLMTADDWAWIAKAANDDCDAADGLKDGLVLNPTRCRFTPKKLACGAKATGRCLTPQQVALAEKLYAPLKDEQGKPVDTGLLPGVPVQPALVPEPFTPGPAYLATVLFGDGVHGSASWDANTFNISRDLPAVDKVMDLHADDPAVEAFVRRGGKLILFQGWADPLVAAQPTIAYYDALATRFGVKGRDAFARLFLVPNMGHCIGGGTTDAFGQANTDAPVPDAGHDLLTALETWVDQGAAPERIVASQLEAGRVVRTRPLCAWPKEARYDGKGDPNDAKSFACSL